MPETLNPKNLRDAVESAQVLSIVSDCATAMPTVVPPKRGGDAYPYQVGIHNGVAVNTVLLDGDASSKNRMEEAIAVARINGEADADALNKLNYMLVEYGNGVSFTETDVPSRAASTHFASASVPGKKGYVATEPEYVEALTNGPNQKSALLALSPFTYLFGTWHSLVKNGIQHPSLIRASTFGVLSSQVTAEDGIFTTPKKVVSGYRSDKFLDTSKNNPNHNKVVTEVRDKVLKGIITKDDSGDNDKNGISAVGLGNIGVGGATEKAPGTDFSAGVAVSSITRSMSVSLALARRIRLSTGSTDVQVAMVALAVYLDRLAAMDLHLRAGCDLYESAAVARVNDREYVVPTVSEARNLFLEVFPSAASAAGWNGNVYTLTGNTVIESILKGK